MNKPGRGQGFYLLTASVYGRCLFYEKEGNLWKIGNSG